MSKHAHNPAAHLPADAHRRDINLPLVAIVGLVSAILVLVIALGLQAWFYRELDREKVTKSMGQKNEALLNLRAEQQKHLEGYRWVERDRVVAIPIERAMTLIQQRAATMPVTPVASPPTEGKP